VLRVKRIGMLRGFVTTIGAAAALFVFSVAPIARATDPTAPVLSPSVTVSSPGTEDCSQRTSPPPPMDTSENVAAGQTSPAPLRVPERPIGGVALGGCGLVLPAGAPAIPPDITAAGWTVSDLDTGEVLGARDPHGRYRPASTLKLLTMIVLMDNLKDPGQVVVGTDTDAAQEGSRVGIGPGGKYTVRQLMLFLMMGSGNDVANALARANGGYDKTVDEMNSTAGRLNALDTRAATISGLDGPGQTTSAYDLALIARQAMARPGFAELIGTQYSQVPGWGPNAGFGIANDNKLLFNYPGAIGGKTGFTDDAGNTYVGLAERNGRRLVVTMLGGSQEPRRQWMQAASLLDWGFSLDDSTATIGQLVEPGTAGTVGTVGTTRTIPAPSLAPAGSSSPSPTPTDRSNTAPGASGISTPSAGAGADPGSTPIGPAAEHRGDDVQFGWLWPTLGLLLVAAGGALGAVFLVRRNSGSGGRHST